MLQAIIMRCVTSILFFIAFILLSSTSNSRFLKTANLMVTATGNEPADFNAEDLKKILVNRNVVGEGFNMVESG